LPRPFTREQIVKRLRKVVADGGVIFGAGSSNGIIAKCAEIGGADLIITYSTGKSRAMGLPTMRIGWSNPLTVGMYHEVANVVQDTPIIGGAEANDLTNMSLERILKVFTERAGWSDGWDYGFDGIINFPTVGFNQTRGSAARKRMSASKMLRGWNREVEMIRIAHEMDIFTMCYAFSAEDAEEMAQAGCDLIVAHVGGTAGGLTGIPGRNIDEACSVANDILAGARDVDPDILCVVHGGPFDIPENTKYIYEETIGQGFVGASSIERIPVESAVINEAKNFKHFTLKPQNRYKGKK
jgi:predicted TIM-barrel enzyme